MKLPKNLCTHKNILFIWKIPNFFSTVLSVAQYVVFSTRAGLLGCTSISCVFAGRKAPIMRFPKPNHRQYTYTQIPASNYQKY